MKKTGRHWCTFSTPRSGLFLPVCCCQEFLDKLAVQSETALEDADCLVLCTDWDEFRRLDLAKARTRMRYPIIVDGRNCLDPAAVLAHGFQYSSIGRAPLEAAAARQA